MSKIVPYLSSSAADFASAEKFEGLESFVAGGSIAVGEAVVFDTAASPSGAISATVVKAPTSAQYAIGVATTAAAAGEAVQVQIRGLCLASVDAGVAAGVLVYPSASTAGELDNAAGAVVGSLAVGITFDVGSASCPVLLSPIL